jgi:NAD(P)-dependent dehydrogenase (short-subunit alcohol dehydrogenase family)|tara:strand:+ start:907 stop:1602 length:696 start_codon:yes stop_codon:yes gene_type:complete
MSYNIVLTGVSSGIGSHLGNYLTKKGHKVIGLSRRTNTRNNFEILKCDISKIKQLKKILNKIQTVDCLINNAGIARSNTKNEVKNFEQIMQTNLNGAYYLSYLLKKKLSRSKKASIINISSISAHQGALGNPGYVSSKSALLGLTKALANDYGSQNIRVNSISLGYFKTPMTIKSYKLKKRRKKINSKMIINRWGEPKDLFGLVEYLVSERASYITGQDFVIDGGWLAKGL